MLLERSHIVQLIVRRQVSEDAVLLREGLFLDDRDSVTHIEQIIVSVLGYVSHIISKHLCAFKATCPLVNG